MWIRVAAALFMLAACGNAAAQVRQCEAADGSPVYTDKACAALDASERPQAPALPGILPRYRSGCVHDLQAFIQELSSAVEVNDVNRLAALYRWKGTSSRAGYDLMHRLEAIAARPLLQVVPIYPETADDGLLAPLPVAGQAPAGLRLDQTLADGVTPASATLWLRRELGCWWVTL
jgi:hypothetical protein